MALQEQPQNGVAASSSTTTTLIDAKSKPEADAYAKKLLETGGSELVQKMLKEALNRGRALDKEVLTAKRQADAEQKRLDDEFSKHTTKLNGQKRDLHDHCKKVLAANQNIEQLLEKLADNNPELDHLMSVRDKFKGETDSIAEKTEKQRQETAELVAKNEKLRAEFETNKKAFDDKVQAKIATWKESESESTRKIAEVQTKLQEHLLLKDRVEREEEFHGNLQQAIEQLTQAEKAYAEKNAEFTRLIDQSKEAIDLYQKNVEVRTKNVAMLQEEKKKLHDEQQEKAALIYKLKNGGIKELKNKVTRLEKELKTVAEKSRQAVAAETNKKA